jgi:hypothetical protein
VNVTFADILTIAQVDLDSPSAQSDLVLETLQGKKCNFDCRI